MSDFLTRLVERTLGAGSPLRPVLASRFEPGLAFSPADVRPAASGLEPDVERGASSRRAEPAGDSVDRAVRSKADGTAPPFIEVAEHVAPRVRPSPAIVGESGVPAITDNAPGEPPMPDSPPEALGAPSTGMVHAADGGRTTQIGVARSVRTSDAADPTESTAGSGLAAEAVHPVPPPVSPAMPATPEPASSLRGVGRADDRDDVRGRSASPSGTDPAIAVVDDDTAGRGGSSRAGTAADTASLQAPRAAEPDDRVILSTADRPAAPTAPPAEHASTGAGEVPIPATRPRSGQTGGPGDVERELDLGRGAAVEPAEGGRAVGESGQDVPAGKRDLVPASFQSRSGPVPGGPSSSHIAEGPTGITPSPTGGERRHGATPPPVEPSGADAAPARPPVSGTPTRAAVAEPEPSRRPAEAESAPPEPGSTGQTSQPRPGVREAAAIGPTKPGPVGRMPRAEVSPAGTAASLTAPSADGRWARDGRPSAELARSSRPVVQVTIGRIEVRAVPPVPQPSPAAPVPAGPRVSLEDYLRERGGGRP